MGVRNKRISPKSKVWVQGFLSKNSRIDYYGTKESVFANERKLGLIMQVFVSIPNKKRKLGYRRQRVLVKSSDVLAYLHYKNLVNIDDIDSGKRFRKRAEEDGKVDWVGIYNRMSNRTKGRTSKKGIAKMLAEEALDCGDTMDKILANRMLRLIEGTTELEDIIGDYNKTYDEETTNNNEGQEP